ncbi:unnamed protein product [Strongylus vulgaris]|uniref:Uncharacterized protein n=1 Tax=Strongylus vulgaris TaxID=40348 RepID=A0A3P7IU06_STRVU|nr:unnamed protein product [Strongylus vulgaris]
MWDVSDSSVLETKARACPAIHTIGSFSIAVEQKIVKAFVEVVNVGIRNAHDDKITQKDDYTLENPTLYPGLQFISNGQD